MYESSLPYCCSVTQSCPNLRDPMDCSVAGFLHCLLEFAQTHIHWVHWEDAIQPSHALLLSSPDLSFSQHQGLFQWVSSSHQVAKVLEFLLQHQSFSEHLGLISCRIDWFDLLAIQETLKRLLQHHNLKASILWHSVFFTSNSHIHIWLLVKLWLWLYRHLLAKWCLWFLIRFLIFS